VRTTHVWKTPVGTTDLATSALASDAVKALVGLRFPRPAARSAVNFALSRLGPATTLEQLVREALRAAR